MLHIELDNKKFKDEMDKIIIKNYILEKFGSLI
jgi:hypothetical protein